MTFVADTIAPLQTLDLCVVRECEAIVSVLQDFTTGYTPKPEAEKC